MRWPWRRRPPERPATMAETVARAELDAIDGTAELHVGPDGLTTRIDVTGPGDTAPVWLVVPVSLPGPA